MEEQLYQPISQKTLEIIENLNREEKPTFLIPTRFISKENAQLAFLLNAYCNQGRDAVCLYRSFFVSSRYEAFQGAVKLIRHHGVKSGRKGILVLDMRRELEDLINPFREEESTLIPDVTVLENREQFETILQTKENLLGAAVVHTDQSGDIAQIFQICRDKGVISLWMDADHNPGSDFTPSTFPILPDLFVFGESFVDYELPFASFSMTEAMHRPWSKMASSLLHSSTYSGNKLSVFAALEKLRHTRWFQQDQELAKACEEIERSLENTIRSFSKYINPGMVKFYQLLGYDFLCEKAHGSRLTVKDAEGREHSMLDAVSGGGAAIHGHSPESLRPIFQEHDRSVDYAGQLEQRFNELLSFPYCFPAVSGATAVETAITLAILASGGQKRILTFKNNYGGNTLVSLICGGDDELHELFAPNYAFVTYLDPYADDAAEQLKKEIQKGDLALIWMELIQGGSMDEVPEALLKIIKDQQGEYGYYIGIDEILMGFYRFGEITSYQKKSIHPDITTLSKALTCSTFPTGATLVSNEVYEKACLKNERLVQRLKTLYVNQFGAHAALYSINGLVRSDQVHKADQVGAILQTGFQEILEETTLFKEIKGCGHIYALEYKQEWMSYYFCKKAIQKGNTFLYIDRVATALTMTEDEATELIRNLKSLYQIKHPLWLRLKGIFINLWMTIQFLTK